MTSTLCQILVFVLVFVLAIVVGIILVSMQASGFDDSGGTISGSTDKTEHGAARGAARSSGQKSQQSAAPMFSAKPIYTDQTSTGQYQNSDQRARLLPSIVRKSNAAQAAVLSENQPQKQNTKAVSLTSMSNMQLFNYILPTPQSASFSYEANAQVVSSSTPLNPNWAGSNFFVTPTAKKGFLSTFSTSTWQSWAIVGANTSLSMTQAPNFSIGDLYLSVPSLTRVRCFTAPSIAPAPVSVPGQSTTANVFFFEIASSDPMVNAFPPGPALTVVPCDVAKDPIIPSTGLLIEQLQPDPTTNRGRFQLQIVNLIPTEVVQVAYCSACDTSGLPLASQLPTVLSPAGGLYPMTSTSYTIVDIPTPNSVLIVYRTTPGNYNNGALTPSAETLLFTQPLSSIVPGGDLSAVTGETALVITLECPLSSPLMFTATSFFDANTIPSPYALSALSMAIDVAPPASDGVMIGYNQYLSVYGVLYDASNVSPLSSVSSCTLICSDTSNTVVSNYAATIVSKTPVSGSNNATFIKVVSQQPFVGFTGMDSTTTNGCTIALQLLYTGGNVLSSPVSNLTILPAAPAFDWSTSVLNYFSTSVRPSVSLSLSNTTSNVLSATSAGLSYVVLPSAPPNAFLQVEYTPENNLAGDTSTTYVVPPAYLPLPTNGAPTTTYAAPLKTTALQPNSTYLYRVWWPGPAQNSGVCSRTASQTIALSIGSSVLPSAVTVQKYGVVSPTTGELVNSLSFGSNETPYVGYNASQANVEFLGIDTGNASSCPSLSYAFGPVTSGTNSSFANNQLAVSSAVLACTSPLQLSPWSFFNLDSLLSVSTVPPAVENTPVTLTQQPSFASALGPQEHIQLTLPVSIPVTDGLMIGENQFVTFGFSGVTPGSNPTISLRLFDSNGNAQSIPISINFQQEKVTTTLPFPALSARNRPIVSAQLVAVYPGQSAVVASNSISFNVLSVAKSAPVDWNGFTAFISRDLTSYTLGQLSSKPYKTISNAFCYLTTSQTTTGSAYISVDYSSDPSFSSYLSYVVPADYTLSQQIVPLKTTGINSGLWYYRFWWPGYPNSRGVFARQMYQSTLGLNIQESLPSGIAIKNSGLLLNSSKTFVNQVTVRSIHEKVFAGYTLNSSANNVEFWRVSYEQSPSNALSTLSCQPRTGNLGPVNDKAAKASYSVTQFTEVNKSCFPRPPEGSTVVSMQVANLDTLLEAQRRSGLTQGQPVLPLVNPISPSSVIRANSR